jgi:hypothetical protein
VEIIPMMSNIHSDPAREVFGFLSESLFDIIPESRSRSSRNAVRLYPGMVFALPRIPQRGLLGMMRLFEIEASEVFGGVLPGGRSNALQPAPRGDRELKVVIGVNLKLGGLRKLLKIWNGRPDSNRRRPAWEIDCSLKIQDIGVYGVNERRSKTPCFHRPASSVR